jgi:GAF domain-containing protein
MQPPPIPADEETRLTALAAAQVMDTPPEVAFDNLAKLAAAICEVPIALVTFVDRHRQWFKAKVGTMIEETPREVSFCGHAVASDQPLIVQDARRDMRFADNPIVVDDPRIVFYAGVPLRATDGAALGTLCVMDRTPRQLTAAQMQALDMLARQATTELRLRRELARVRAARSKAVPEVAASLSPGQVVGGRYRIERAIGKGAMGIVYTALDLRAAGTRVAVKLLRPDLIQNAASVERLARAAGRK